MPTPEELLALVKIRGLDKGFQRTPLREFKGTLEKITANLVDRFTPPRTEIIFNFVDVEVIETVEPYPFPIAQISIMHSNREQSFWGVFAASEDKLIPANEVWTCIEGKELHMKMTGGHMMWDAAKGEETPRDCWELIAIEGEAETSVGGTTTKADATTRALELLDGKNIADWNQIVFQDSTVKADGELVTSILSNTFIPSMEEKGFISKDENGIYHLVPPPF